MKKTLIWLMVVVFVATIALVGIGCKTTTSGETTAGETTAGETTTAETTAAETTAEETAAGGKYGADDPFPSTISGKVACMSYWTAGIEYEGLSMVAEQFMKDYPNIKLTIIPKPGDEILPALQTNLASTEPVDTYFYWPGLQQQPYVEAGWCADLTDISQKMKYDEIAASTSRMRRFIGFGDAPYTVNINLNLYAIWYNKAKFTEAGIEKEPKTWDEFLAVCDKLLAANIYPLLKSKGDIGNPQHSWMDKFWQRTQMDGNWRDKFLAGLSTEAEINSPEMKKAADLWDDLAKYWDPDSNTRSYGDAYMAFARGDAAMQCIGDWIIGSYEGEMKMKPFKDYDMFLFPTIDPNVPPMETTTANDINLSMAGKDNVAAQAWIAYWMRPETQTLYCEHTSNTTAITSVKVSSPMINKIREVSKGRDMYGDCSQPVQIHTAVSDEIEKRSFQEITTDQFIQNLIKIYATYQESQKK